MFPVGYCRTCGALKRLDTADPSVVDRSKVRVKCTGNCDGRTSHKVKKLKEVS